MENAANKWCEKLGSLCDYFPAQDEHVAICEILSQSFQMNDKQMYPRVSNQFVLIERKIRWSCFCIIAISQVKISAISSTPAF